MQNAAFLMSINLLGIDLIKRSEGLKLSAYLDAAGIPTIGYGHTADVNIGTTITQAQAEKLLIEDIAICETTLDRYVTVPLTDNQRAALVSLIFNVGITLFRNSSLLRLLNAGDYVGAADQFDKWIYTTISGKKKILRGLITRRGEEKSLFLSIAT